MHAHILKLSRQDLINKLHDDIKEEHQITTNQEQYSDLMKEKVIAFTCTVASEVI